eukprot:2654838-Rhodomonas_salina.1
MMCTRYSPSVFFDAPSRPCPENIGSAQPREEGREEEKEGEGEGEEEEFVVVKLVMEEEKREAVSYTHLRAHETEADL